jgi:hypothetical protein
MRIIELQRLVAFLILAFALVTNVAGQDKTTNAPPNASIRDATDVKQKTENGAEEIASVSLKKDVAAKPKPQDPTQDKWQFQFAPYLWIAGINGQGGVNDLTVDIDSGLTDDNVHLNFGFMGTFEARRNKLVILTDLQYSNLGTERPTPGPFFGDTTAAFKTFVLDPEVGYRVAENVEKGRVLDVLGGFRYWHVRADLDFGPGILAARSISRSKGWVDAVGGVRGRAHLTPKLFLTGKADLGGGGSKFTFQLFGGVGYLITPKIALIAGYRDLDVNYNRNGFLFDGALTGPMIGAAFRF